MRFESLSKHFGSASDGSASDGSAALALDTINLEIRALKTTALVGQSGSGKSTLLALICGLIQPSLGTLEVLGAPLDYPQLAKLRRRLGYAVQGGGLFPHKTVFENVTLVARLEGWSETEINNRYAFLLDMMELPQEFRDRYPHSLSGGQQQRVALCRALMLKPELLLLDEPFSALDPITRQGIHQRLLAMQAEEARSIILVSHDMLEAEKLSDDLVILQEGKVIQAGLFQDVRRAPGSDYVSQLFQAQGLAV